MPYRIAQELKTACVLRGSTFWSWTWLPEQHGYHLLPERVDLLQKNGAGRKFCHSLRKNWYQGVAGSGLGEVGDPKHPYLERIKNDKVLAFMRKPDEI